MNNMGFAGRGTGLGKHGDGIRVPIQPPQPPPPRTKPGLGFGLLGSMPNQPESVMQTLQTLQTPQQPEIEKRIARHVFCLPPRKNTPTVPPPKVTEQEFRSLHSRILALVGVLHSLEPSGRPIECPTVKPGLNADKERLSTFVGLLELLDLLEWASNVSETVDSAAVIAESFAVVALRQITLYEHYELGNVCFFISLKHMEHSIESNGQTLSAEQALLFHRWREALRIGQGISLPVHHEMCDIVTKMLVPRLQNTISSAQSLEDALLLRIVDAWCTCLPLLQVEAALPVVGERVDSLCADRDYSKATQIVSTWEARLEKEQVEELLWRAMQLITAQLKGTSNGSQQTIPSPSCVELWKELMPAHYIRHILANAAAPRIRSELIACNIEYGAPLCAETFYKLADLLSWSELFAEEGVECWEVFFTALEEAFFARWLLSLQDTLEQHFGDIDFYLLNDWYISYKLEFAKHPCLLASETGFILHFQTALQLIDSVVNSSGFC